MANAEAAMEGSATMYAVISQEFFGGSGLAGFSFMIFNLLCAPCFAAMGAIKREMNNWKWTAASIIYMCVLAYAASLCTYQIGLWFTPAGGNIIGTVVAAVIILFAGFMLLRPDPNKKKAVK
jgi:ferrous iron transport protein B